jgi:hypothetical protein
MSPAKDCRLRAEKGIDFFSESIVHLPLELGRENR